MSTSRGGSNSTSRMLGNLRIINNDTTPIARRFDGPIKIIHDYKPAEESQSSIRVEVVEHPSQPDSNHTASSPAMRPITSSNQEASWRSSVKSMSAMDDSFIFITSSHRLDEKVEAVTPVGHQSASDLHQLDHHAIQNHSFHTTHRVYDQKINGKVLRYFKKNPRDSYMSELEALAVGFFRLIAPNYFPSARAHYDKEGHYIGVSSKAILDFKSLKELPLSYADLEDKMLVAGLATSLTASYIFEEDDLHRGNIDKSGMRIDGDGLLWPILYQFKKGNIGDSFLRAPNENTFTITESDIRIFPELKDANPFYWPSKPAPIIAESTRNLLRNIGAPISRNAFSIDENNLFISLGSHPVFIYHKFKTLLKYILTSEKMYRNIARMHLREHINFLDVTTNSHKNLIDAIVQHQTERLARFRETLINMPEFSAFIKTDGPKALLEIIDEFKKHNAKVEGKLTEIKQQQSETTSVNDLTSTAEKLYVNLLVNPEEIQQRYGEIVVDTLMKKTTFKP